MVKVVANLVGVVCILMRNNKDLFISFHTVCTVFSHVTKHELVGVVYHSNIISRITSCRRAYHSTQTSTDATYTAWNEHGPVDTNIDVAKLSSCCNRKQ